MVCNSLLGGPRGFQSVGSGADSRYDTFVTTAADGCPEPFAQNPNDVTD